MLNTYSEYIDSYLKKTCLGSRPCPGEHHFVSAYLVPRMFDINQRVPDYINPDGTKGIIGDVVYYKDHKHQFGIEAKLETIRLTKGEFNEWIVNTDSARWPHVFIGIGTKGIGLCSWTEFRETYISAVQEKKCDWVPSSISEGYGPMKKVNTLLSKLPSDKFFRLGDNASDASELERIFVEALRKETAASHKL